MFLATSKYLGAILGKLFALISWDNLIFGIVRIVLVEEVYESMDTIRCDSVSRDNLIFKRKYTMQMLFARGTNSH